MSRLRLVWIFVLALPKLAFAADPPATEFLSGDAARDAIVDDSLDPYFSRLTAHEMSLKTGSAITGESASDKVVECRKRYRAAVIDPTEQEKADVQWAVDQVQPALLREYPLFGRTPFRFIKVSDTLEAGMPHTRGSCIVLAETMLSSFHLAHQAGGAGRPLSLLLVHEQTHVVERLHPELFTPLFTDVFHFVHAKHVKTDQWLDDRQLINPDGTVCDWVMVLDDKSVVLPLIACRHADSTEMGADIGTIAVTMVPDGDGYKPKESSDGKPQVRRLETVRSYMMAVGPVNDDYHPNEIAADWMSTLVAENLRGGGKSKPTTNPSRQQRQSDSVRTWAKKAFADDAGPTSRPVQ